MISDTSKLPESPEELKALIAQLQASHQAELEKLKGRHEVQVRLLEEQVRQLYDKLFGRKSEKSRYGDNSP